MLGTAYLHAELVPLSVVPPALSHLLRVSLVQSTYCLNTHRQSHENPATGVRVVHDFGHWHADVGPACLLSRLI